MHTIKITPNLLSEYQCTSGTFIRLPNGIESKLFLPELECSSAVTETSNPMLFNSRPPARPPPAAVESPLLVLLCNKNKGAG